MISQCCEPAQKPIFESSSVFMAISSLIVQLPDDLLYSILSYVDVANRATVRCVCKAWSKLNYTHEGHLELSGIKSEKISTIFQLMLEKKDTIRSLSLSGVQRLNTEIFVKYIRKMPLEALNLSGSDVMEKHVLVMGYMPTLKSLNLSNCKLLNETALSNAGLLFPNITSLNLSNNSFLFFSLARFSSLLSLNLSNYNDAENLHLPWTRFYVLFDQGNPPLTSLDLSGCSCIKDKDLEPLKKLKLKVLNLSGCTQLRRNK